MDQCDKDSGVTSASSSLASRLIRDNHNNNSNTYGPTHNVVTSPNNHHPLGSNSGNSNGRHARLATQDTPRTHRNAGLHGYSRAANGNGNTPGVTPTTFKVEADVHACSSGRSTPNVPPEDRPQLPPTLDHLRPGVTSRSDRSEYKDTRRTLQLLMYRNNQREEEVKDVEARGTKLTSQPHHVGAVSGGSSRPQVSPRVGPVGRDSSALPGAVGGGTRLWHGDQSAVTASRDSDGGHCGERKLKAGCRYDQDRQQKTQAVVKRYLETKTNMLLLIEGALKMQLEIRSLKKEFVNVLRDFNHLNIADALPLSDQHSGEQTEELAQPPPFSLRARARAEYADRRRRISSRRSQLGLDVLNAQDWRTIENGELNHRNTMKTDLASASTSKPSVGESDGEYVTLKKSPDENIVFSRRAEERCRLRSDSLNDTSLWLNSEDDRNTVNSEGSKAGTAAGANGIKYATSDKIQQMYTAGHPQSLSSISLISRISPCSTQEHHATAKLQVSADSACSTQHAQSTFNHPLHSTLNESPSSVANELDTGVFSNKSDITTGRRTLLSSDSGVSHTNGGPHYVTENETPPPSVAEKSFRNTAKVRVRRQSSIQGTHIYINKGPDVNIAEITRLAARNNARHPKPPEASPQLCSVCHLHPNLGVHCIFNTEGDVLSITDEESEVNCRPAQQTSVRALRSRSRSGRQHRTRHTYTDTDCDSSYLSEYVDEGTGEDEELDIAYDQKRGVMKHLPRQTGSTCLRKEPSNRYPIGLSDSDMAYEKSQKHISLEATRSSYPDITGLSMPNSRTASFADDIEDDMSDSTLHGYELESSVIEDILPLRRQPQTRDSMVVNNSTSESPSGSSGNLNQRAPMQVPVNSPNITDSGGSSRQNTDTYDYVEMPVSVYMPAVHKYPQQCSVPHKYRRPLRKRHVANKLNPLYYSGSTCSSDFSRSCSVRSYRTRTSHRSARSRQELDSGFLTQTSAMRSRRSGLVPGDVSSALSDKHITIMDPEGNLRTVVRHRAVARNLEPGRKRVLKKRLKQFHSPAHNLAGSIQTLAHF